MPDYDEAIFLAAKRALITVADDFGGEEQICADAGKLARAVCDAVAPLFADAVAERIAAFADEHAPKGDHVPSARHRHLMTAARVASGAFNTREEEMRQVAGALERGDFACCDAEATMARLAEAEPRDIRCRACGYDGLVRAYEDQGDGTWLCQGCPPETATTPPTATGD